MFRIILFSITFTSLLLSHSGRTDSNGGHYDRSSGEYHYHNSGYSNNENHSYQSSNQYVLSLFQYKEFKGFGDTFNSKKECMDMRYKLWIENRDEGWTYGCRRKDNE